MIVDTTVATPTEVADCIIDSLSRWKADPEFSAAYISAERLSFPDDEPDAELISSYSARLEEGLEIPEIKVFEKDGDFFVLSGVEAALAQSFSEKPFIEVTLVKESAEGKKYVRMKNSL